MAVQPRVGILPQRRARFGRGDCDHFAFDGPTLDEMSRCLPCDVFNMGKWWGEQIPPFLFEMNRCITLRSGSRILFDDVQ